MKPSFLMPDTEVLKKKKLTFLCRLSNSVA